MDVEMMCSRNGRLCRRTKAVILAVVLLAACGAVGSGDAARAQETGSSPGFPVLLANGAIYPWDHDAGRIPPAFRVDGYRSSGLYLVQCAGSIEESWLEAVREAGGKVCGYIPYNTLLVAVDNRQLAGVEGLPFVSWTGIYQPYFKVSPSLQLQLSQGREATVAALLYDGSLLEETAQALRDMGVEVLEEEKDAWCGILVMRVAPHMLDEVAALRAVEWLELYTGGTLAGNAVASPRGVSAGDLHPDRAAAVSARPEKVALADSGLASAGADGLPQALRSRVTGVYSFRGDGGEDASGHGTALAGVLLAGDSLSSEGDTARPNPVELAVYATGYGVGPLPQPASMTALLERAYLEGARSLLDGSVPEGRESLCAYGIYSFQRDAFAWDHADMTIVEPAGNEGTDADGDGVVDRGSLLGGAAAKNVLAVGGCEGAGRAGSYRVPTYGELEGAFAGRFPASPLKEDGAEGSTPGMAAFSSRGPTTDGRIKPDLVAAATGVVTFAAAGTAGRPAAFPVGDRTCVVYGTGVAAALVAGRVASLRSELTAARGVPPSAALVKAFLVNGALDLYPGQYGEAVLEVPRAPNPVEGWGKCDFTASTDRETWLRVIDDGEGMRSGESRVFRVEVKTGSQLRVTLAWSDYPSLPQARLHLVNDLDLRVIDPGGGFSYPNGRTSRDPLNNVERVILDVSGKPGTYTLEIAAANVPMAPQPYALVVQLF